ncbi:MAG: hypothetical protein QM724_10190 [Flavobacteriales bacterium]
MRLLPTFITTILLAGTLRAQDAPPSSHIEVKDPSLNAWYLTSSGEWIFSMPVLDVNGSDKGSIVRFAPFFNLRAMANYDITPHFGFFTGLTVRNLGFIYDVPGSPDRFKFRTYNVGIPVGLKVGRMNRGLLFAGYELELPFNYKEKHFVNDDRVDRFNSWLSDRNERLFHSVMLGLQGVHGTTITVKYYLSNFHNTGFTEVKDGVEVKPYAGLNAHILYVSLAVDLFDGREFIFHRSGERKKKRERKA